MTPEGKVKAAVKKLLARKEQWGYIWTDWPVPSGFGKSTLDCMGCYHSLCFAVETKAPGKKPTPRQLATIDEMQRAGVAVFVIDGSPASLLELELWLDAVSTSYPGKEGPTDHA